VVSPGGEVELFHDITRVTFLELTDEVIARYLAAAPVLDKAGAYALQHHGEWIIADVEGSRNNVVGLPTEKLREILRAAGLLHT
jgi:septum formation protein